NGRIVRICSPRMQHTPRSEPLAERGILGIVRILWLLFGVQVVEVAEELVEAVDRGQELIPIPQVILAELCGGVALVFQNSATVGSSPDNPPVAPGRPTFVRPVRTGDCPVMKAPRPAVHLAAHTN